MEDSGGQTTIHIPLKQQPTLAIQHKTGKET
jgi:hypothetical protein